MIWNTWIEVKPDDSKDDDVQQLYQSTRDNMTGRSPDTVRLNSLIPKVAKLLYDLQNEIYNGTEGLTLREKEISALLVSTYNGCVH